MESRTKTEGDTMTKPADDTIKQVVQRKRGNPAITSNGGENVEPGDNARFLRFALASWDLPPVDISDPVQVENRIKQYFQHCADNDRKPQIVGMANWLGVDRTTLNSWKRGEYRTETHSHIIKKAVDMLEEMWVDYMQSGKINPASGIFLGKNFYGYKDNQDIIITPNNPLESTDAETARKKYVDALPESTED